MSYETLAVERRGGAATIRLNRPDALNAFNAKLRVELGAALDEAADDEAVRAVCLTGAGRVVLLRRGPQGHVRQRGDARGTSERGEGPQRGLPPDHHHDPAHAQAGRRRGQRTGGRRRLLLALACDLLVAKESAYLLLAFVNIGLVPDGGSSLFIPTRAGMARAAEMAMLGERIPAAQALEWGLVNRVLAEDEFDAGVTALVDRLAAGPTKSYAGTKRQLNNWLYSRMDEQLAFEASVQQEMAGSGDFAEGVMAFLQKRPAAFQGG